MLRRPAAVGSQLLATGNYTLVLLEDTKPLPTRFFCVHKDDMVQIAMKAAVDRSVANASMDQPEASFIGGSSPPILSLIRAGDKIYRVR